MTNRYAIALWDVADPQASAEATSRCRTMEQTSNWRLERPMPGAMLFLKGVRPPLRLLSDGQGFVLGDLYDRAGRPAPAALSLGLASFHPLASRLIDRYWGRYVAVFTSPAHRPQAVLRDPSGAMTAAAFTADGLFILGSEFPDPLLKLAPTLSVNWSVLAHHLADPGLSSSSSALNGIDLVPPGGLLDLTASGVAHQLWRPAKLTEPVNDLSEEARRDLRETLDRVVAAFTEQRSVIAEVSGGLDSALVAAALVKAGADVRAWISFVSDSPAADERLYARAIADHLGFSLTLAEKPLVATFPLDIEAMQTGLEPSINALDHGYDIAMAKRAECGSADAIMTGFGGDAVFFQMADPAIIEDRTVRLGVRSVFTPFTGRLARWARRPALGLIYRALRARRTFAGYPRSEAAWLPQDAGAAHPWWEGAEELPPAKRLHLASLCQMQTGYGRSRRGDTATLIHPHLTQPVMETCLRTPTDVLVEGGRDRGLARNAFGGRLPQVVLDRRSKGDLSIPYARAFVAVLPDIRDYILGGLLVQHHVIDRAALEAALDESVLAAKGGALELLHAVALEGWARQWSKRLRHLERQRNGGRAGLPSKLPDLPTIQ